MTPNPPESLNLSSSADMMKSQKMGMCPFLRNQMQSQIIPPKKVKPVKITNSATNSECFDMLCRSQTNNQPIGCTESVCQGNIVYANVAENASREPHEIIDHARDLMDQYFKSMNEHNSLQHKFRINQIEDQIIRTGTYDLTDEELLFGAKTAWRNAARCIGRIQWNKLKLFDYRHITTAKEMFDALCNHLSYCQNGGNLLSATTFFPHRTDPSKDFRIWNSQLISYAAYENEDGTITGDPPSLEFTKLCMKLGWQPARTEYDILPLVLSANGEDPELFEYPEGFILEVPMTHPKYEWFEKLKLKWYAVPAISNMQVDVGGLIFPGCAFSGWYTSSEIGCRDLLDPNRRNLIKPIAVKMGLNTRNLSTLWKDKVMLEVNIAVLHSFQKSNVTIVDHHTASETFMKHLENESRVRGGCPADKMFIIPPMSASSTRVYHQEMLNYRLRPSFEYQEPAMKTHKWKVDRGFTESSTSKNIHKFKIMAKFVMIANMLYRSALQKRVKATILYATETGKSQLFAEQLVKPLSFIYDVQLSSMSDFKPLSMEKENLLFCVVSTTGNGDAPESAHKFLKYLKSNQLNRNCMFSVLALGSSAYPNFCAFGTLLDKLLAQCGAQRLNEVSLCDELCNQEQDFLSWAGDIFNITSDKFKLDINHVPKRLLSMENSNFNENNTRLKLIEFLYEDAIDEALSRFHNKNIITCQVKNKPLNLMTNVDESCVLVKFAIDKNEFKYEAGDHVAVCPANNAEVVDDLLKKFKDIEDPDETVRIQIIDDAEANQQKSWQNHSKLPTCSVRTIFTKFLDISTTPSKQLISFMSEFCANEAEKAQMQLLSSNDEVYDSWKSKKSPNLLEVFEEISSCSPPIAPMIARLNAFQPRFYSISSSQLKHPDEVHLTVGVVEYNINGNTRQGVCSNYLKNLKRNDEVQIFYRKASSFHLPASKSSQMQPMILVGPGTGIAPFRSFWQELDALKSKNSSFELPRVLLFTGNKTRNHDLYRDEKNEMMKLEVLSEHYSALSRDSSVKKTYVQDLLQQQSVQIHQLLKHENAHIYICGDSLMADDVHQTFRKIIASQEHSDETSAEQFMQKLKEQSRYHKDTFGVVQRAEKKQTLGCIT